jgi:cobalt-zinc-cadmium efflux system outer membrane protein
MLVRAFLPFVLTCASFPALAQQEHQHHQHAAAGENPPPASAPLQPPLAPDTDAYELDSLVDNALASNPTVEQAAEVIARAEGLRQQAGRYPNPTIGVTGDENSPNATFRGGEIGLFVEQRIVTAGKLGLNRDIASQEAIQARAIDDAQRQSVRNSVRKHFYETLGAQWELDVQRRLLEMTEGRAHHARLNVGQADQPDVLRGEIEAQRSSIELRQAQNQVNRAWTQLALAIGKGGSLFAEVWKTPRLDRTGAATCCNKYKSPSPRPKSTTMP